MVRLARLPDAARDALGPATDAVRDVEALRAAALAIFGPALASAPPLSYVDADGDVLAIASDAELARAVADQLARGRACA